ncbi:hypothetical protein HPP92_020078 [Vanilla planifolia]|uniref:Uncharacterized protein n=1 Tax=Vanilla planifolia TaxID=51239 RepID=A0A835Q6J7_VANPL|nr:hypothetical protein HPP92_020078 [Vanilla planifolia]
MEFADESMIAAAEALILCSLSTLDRPPPATENDLWAPDPPQSATGLEKIPSSFLPPWGLRSRRTHCPCVSKPRLKATRSRPSPATPLDFSADSLPTNSGSDGATSSSDISPAIRGFAGYVDKKAMTKLREQEMALVEENAMIEQMVESMRKEMAKLIEENLRLKVEKSSSFPGVEASTRRRFLLPDLNKPLMET